MPKVPTPKARPPFGADDTEFTTRTSGPLQVGHMNSKGDTTFDDGKTVIPGKTIVPPTDPQNYRR